jgi:hypothetical protein
MGGRDQRWTKRPGVGEEGQERTSHSLRCQIIRERCDLAARELSESAPPTNSRPAAKIKRRGCFTHLRYNNMMELMECCDVALLEEETAGRQSKECDATKSTLWINHKWGGGERRQSEGQ